MVKALVKTNQEQALRVTAKGFRLPAVQLPLTWSIEKPAAGDS